MTDITIWTTYENTMEFFHKLHDKNKKDKMSISKPAFKIMEDEMVVGILTDTNQFIQISPPEMVNNIIQELNLPSIKNENYIINANTKNSLLGDVMIETSQEVDKERVDYINKIKLETSFYNVFRNTIRILINDYSNVKIRTELESEISNQYLTYYEKLKNVEELLRELVKDKMQFTGDKNYYKLIKEVFTCFLKEKADYLKQDNLCAITEDGNSILILPEKNLLTDKINEPIYYKKMADELTRYSRINSFMFQPQSYLSFGNINYKLNDDEIIIIQSLITQGYFGNLVPSITNKYIKHNSYDEVMPVVSQPYNNRVFTKDNSIEAEGDFKCDTKNKERISSSIWKKCFPSNYTEIEYENSTFCSFNLIIDLIETHTGNKPTPDQIRDDLINEYLKYVKIDPTKHTRIYDVLSLEGKKTYIDLIVEGKMTLRDFINLDIYVLTTLDFWMLITKYEIPTIFISPKTILQTNHRERCFVGYGKRDDAFNFIIIPLFRQNSIPKYSVVQSKDGDIKISLDKMNKTCMDEMIDRIHDKKTVYQYLNDFSKITGKKVEKFKRVYEEDEEVDEPNNELPIKKTSSPTKKSSTATKKTSSPVNKKTRRTRCPNGTRKNATTGNCEKFGKI